MSRYPPSLSPVYRTAIPCYYKKAFCIHRIMKSRGNHRFISLHILLCDHSTKAYLLYWGTICLLINTIFLKKHILKKLTQNYTPILNFCTANWQKAILCFISLTKEAAEQSSCCFKRSAAEAFRLFSLTLDRCLFVCLHDQAGKVIFYLCPINQSELMVRGEGKKPYAEISILFSISNRNFCKCEFHLMCLLMFKSYF